MSLEEVLGRARVAAEQRMTARVTVWRKTGQRAPQDEKTGRERPVWEDVYTNLPFRLKRGTEHRTRTVGGVEREESVRWGSLPALYAVGGEDPAPLDLRDNDHLEITVGDNTGRVYRAIETDWYDQAKDRTVALVAEQRPREWP